MCTVFDMMDLSIKSLDFRGRRHCLDERLQCPGLALGHNTAAMDEDLSATTCSSGIFFRQSTAIYTLDGLIGAGSSFP